MENNIFFLMLGLLFVDKIGEQDQKKTKQKIKQKQWLQM